MTNTRKLVPPSIPSDDAEVTAPNAALPTAVVPRATVPRDASLDEASDVSPFGATTSSRRRRFMIAIGAAALLAAGVVAWLATRGTIMGRPRRATWLSR
jgi:hypothetical protein